MLTELHHQIGDRRDNLDRRSLQVFRVQADLVVGIVPALRSECPKATLGRTVEVQHAVGQAAAEERVVEIIDKVLEGIILLLCDLHGDFGGKGFVEYSTICSVLYKCREIVESSHSVTQPSA